MVVLLVALALPAMPAGAAPEPPTLRFPLEGELYYYTGLAEFREGEPVAWEMVVRYVGAEEVLDRGGASRSAYVVESVTPGWDYATNTVAFHGDPEALLEDPAATRRVARYDIATFELLETRSASLHRSEGQTIPGTQARFGWQIHRREFFDSGLPDPFAALWGRALPADGTLRMTWIEGSAYGGWGMADGLQLLEVAGFFAEAVEVPRTPFMPTLVEVQLDPLGWGDVAGQPALGFRGAHLAPWYPRSELERTRELWFADGLALPVRERVDSVVTYEGKAYTYWTDLTLARHDRGRAELPWGAPGAGGSFAPETGPLGRWGPSEGSARLAYVLRDAVASVRADPTVLGFQRMALAGEPVLVKAFYQLRDHPHALKPIPEARWWLVFHDSKGGEVVIESKRPLGAPVSVNREIDGRNVFVGGDIEGVRPAEVPSVGPTLGGAVSAWERFRAAEAPAANVMYYGLQRMLDGSVRPILWAGWTLDDFGVSPDAALVTSRNLTMLAVDLDGLPRRGLDSQDSYRSEVEPLAASSAGPAPPSALPGPAPVLAAAGVGVAALAGLALKLLGPLYTRLDRAKVVGHPARRALLQLLEREPGVHLEAAQRALGVGAGTLAHHVGILERAGLLRVQRAGRFRRLYPAALNGQAALRDAALRPPRSAALHKLVTEHPGVGLREAARLLGVPASSLQWHVARLEQAGLVERRAGALHPRPV